MQAAADRIAVLPDQTAVTAFCHLADKLTEAFHLNLLALMEDDSPEPVHKARVTLRRFRAALNAFEPILDEDAIEAMQDRTRSLFRILGGIRDADVIALRHVGTDRATDTLDEAAFQRRKVRKHLKRKKADGFRKWVLRRLAGKRWRKTGKKAKMLRDAPVKVLAVSGMNQAWADCTSNGDDLRVMPVRGQHDLRKDLKMLRYQAEFFADLWPVAAQDAFLSALRQVQDDLGEITDTALAKSRGLDATTDTAMALDRAATAWEALQSQGPVWAKD